MKKICTLLVALGFLSFASMAQADLFNFHLIGNDNEPSNDLGPQLLMDVTDEGSGVNFTFQNIGDIDSFIGQIYFDANPNNFLDFSSANLTSVGGVDFIVNQKKNLDWPNLPGGNTVSFFSNWGVDGDNPVSTWGINNFAFGDSGVAESLTINFSYIDPQLFGDVIGAINSGDLRVGMHVQGIAPNGQSEAYVNDVAPVPEPATMLLLGTGLVALAGVSRRRKEK